MLYEFMYSLIYVVFWFLAGGIFAKIGSVLRKIIASSELDYYKTYEWVNSESKEDYWLIFTFSIVDGLFAVLEVGFNNKENIHMLFFIGLLSLLISVGVSYFFEIYDKRYIHTDKTKISSY